VKTRLLTIVSLTSTSYHA